MKTYLNELFEAYFKESGLPITIKDQVKKVFIDAFIEGTLVNPYEWAENVRLAPPEVQERYKKI